MFIRQDNLTIRNATAADASQLGIWWRDGKVMAHAGFPRGLLTTDDEITKDLSTDTDETCRRLIIEVDSSPVGEMNYRNKGNHTAEIGIKICDFSMQEKGYGTRFIRMLIDALFENYGYEKIILDTNVNNKRAQHVYEKIGFRKVRERHNCWNNQLGEPQSAVDYELTKSEYVSRTRKSEGNISLNDEKIIEKWDADIYDQTETQTNDVDFLLKIIHDGGRRVLEVCCGSGRILVPLARAGYGVTGIDKNEAMLARIAPKAERLDNIHWHMADAIYESWGEGFDIVVLAGNILINIESDMDYKEAQQLFIRRAYDALVPGGYIYLDFDCVPESERERIYGSQQKNVGKTIWCGSDSEGNTGSSKLLNCGYNTDTQICTFLRELTFSFKDGRTITRNTSGYKHIPTLPQVTGWLGKTGFTVESMYGGHDGIAVSDDTWRAIIYARKG